MSVLNTAARLASGKSASPFLKEVQLTKVPYIPITQKTPSRHPVYSMIPPTLAGIMSMYNRDKDNGT